MKNVDLTHQQIRSAVQAISETLPRPSPKGSCLHTSNEIVEHFDKEGHTRVSIQFGFLDDKQHAWVEVWNKTEGTLLVDLTADQFGNQFPPTILDTPTNAFNNYPYKYDDQ